MEYAAESGKQEIAEELLSWFLERKAFDCFAACLFQVSLVLIFSLHLSVMEQKQTTFQQ